MSRTFSTVSLYKGSIQSLTFQLLPNQITLLEGAISPMALVTEVTIYLTMRLADKPLLNCMVANSNSAFTSVVSFSHKIQESMNRETTALSADQPGDECHHWGTYGPWPDQWAHPASLPLGPGGPGNPIPGWPTVPFSPGRPGLPGDPGKPLSPVESKIHGQCEKNAARMFRFYLQVKQNSKSTLGPFKTRGPWKSFCSRGTR